MALPLPRHSLKIHEPAEDTTDIDSISELESCHDGDARAVSINSQDFIVSPADPTELDTGHAAECTSRQKQVESCAIISEETSVDSHYSTFIHSMSKCSHDRDETEQRIASTKGEGWYPFWLGQPILAACSCLFICLAIGLPVILFFSQRNDGLVEANPDYTYVWRFVPTAFTTLITLLWSRVEFQAQRYMSWMAVKAGTFTESRALQLDYTQILPHRVLLKSLRRKHFLVAFVVLAGHILKIQVVLSAAIFLLEDIQSDRPVQIQVLDSFAQSANITNGTNGHIYYDARAIQELKKPYPFGLAKEAAYQNFTRGTREAPTTVTVDGLFTDMKCLQLENYTSIREVIKKLGEQGWNETTVEFTFKFKGCDQTFTIANKFTLSDIHRHPYTETFLEGQWVVNSTLNPPRPCPSLPQKHPQFLQVGFLYSLGLELADEPEGFAAIICSPEAWLSQVQVVDDGVSPNLTLLPGQEKRPVESDTWILMKDSTQNVKDASIDGTLDSLGTLRAGFGAEGASVRDTDPSIYSSELLEKSVLNLTRYFGPMVAHSYLREESHSQITGTMHQVVPRLMLNQGICWAMATLFLISGLISTWALFYSRSQKASGIWNRDPATILGCLLFLNSKSRMYRSIAEPLQIGKHSRKMLWSYSTYAPVVLRTWARALYIALTLPIIAALIALLQVSLRSEGFATVGEERWSGIAWRLTPSIVMLCITLYVRSCDNAIRDLATLSNLSTRSCQIQELDLSFSDMLGIRALYQSVRLAVPAVTLSQILSIICGFLTSIAAILFSSETIPGGSRVEIQLTSWFGSRYIPVDDAQYNQAIGNTGSLLTQKTANITYPHNTYADLLFPSLEIPDSLWNGGSSVNITVTAATLRPSCSLIPSEDTFVNQTDHIHGTFIGVNQRSTCPDGTVRDYQDEAFLRVKDGTPDYYFGEAFDAPGSPEWAEKYCGTDIQNLRDSMTYRSWNLQKYLWGKASYHDENVTLDHFEAWTCNYTWYAIDTTLALVRTSESTIIDHDIPPVPDQSSIRLWEPPFSIPYTKTRSNSFDVSLFAFSDFDRDPAEDIGEFFAPEFNLVIEPYGPVKKNQVAEKGHSDLILDALHSNLGIVSAQLANLAQRLELDEESVTVPTTHGELPMITAKVYDNKRKRLVQSPAVTYVIVAILLLTVLVNAWALLLPRLPRRFSGKRSWLLDVDLAPNRFNSIAMMDSLLEGSNYFDLRPESTHLQSVEELAESWGGKSFKLGWFARASDGTEEFTVGVVDDPDSKFVGTKR